MNHRWMQRALTLARLGQGSVSPNPMVGAVLVHQERIIGEGWHGRYGGPHAEVRAIQSVATANKSLISESTLYVTLEPCHHYGKTPPCVDLVLAHRIPKVVIAHQDPNPLTSGKSIEKLRHAGVRVELGMLEQEAVELNRAFVWNQATGKPYVILKWAQTTQGILGSGAKRLHISEPATQRLVHQWRSEVDAILVGRATALLDNPRLDLRHAVLQKSLLRLAWCRETDLLPDCHLRDGSLPTLFLRDMAIEDLDGLSQLLMQEKKAILMVEGGAETLHRFINSGLWNEIRRITHNGEQPGIAVSEPIFAPILPPSANLTSQFTLGHDHIEVYQNTEL